MKFSEKDKQAAFAVLALLALAVAAYAVFFADHPDPRSASGGEFYLSLVNSSTVGFLFDVRGAQDSAQAAAIYQCGVNIIGKGRFAGKTVQSIACDKSGCIASSSSGNGSRNMDFSEAQKQFAGIPYIQIMPGSGDPVFFLHHMEIYIPANITGNVTCDISASEEYVPANAAGGA